MKLPTRIADVTVWDEPYRRPYPPLGFYPIAEHQLGNGDMFGLYWPIGREDHEPIVAETMHDGWWVEPHFSSLDAFLGAAARAGGSDDGGDCYDDSALVETPSRQEDPRSPAACLAAARESLRTQRVEDAIDALQTAVTVLPEYAEAHALLCTQYRRVGKTDLAIKAAVRAVISPPCFGTAPPQLVKWLSSQRSGPPELASDPIWVHRERLALKFGGTKENDGYSVFRDAIDGYIAAEEFVSASSLIQTYAHLMSRETTSFQERQGFDASAYVSWQREVANSLAAGGRTLALSQWSG